MDWGPFFWVFALGMAFFGVVIATYVWFVFWFFGFWNPWTWGIFAGTALFLVAVKQYLDWKWD